MSTKFIYALILTISGAALQLLIYFTGFQTEKLATGQYLQWIGFIVMIVVLWFGIKAVRDENEGQYLTYGKGVGSGVLISLYSGLMSSIYSYIHFTFVNPEFADYQIALIRPQWEAAGLGDAQMEQAEKMTRMMLGPGAQAIMTPILVVLFGLIISLIISAMLKRNPPDEDAAAA